MKILPVVFPIFAIATLFSPQTARAQDSRRIPPLGVDFGAFFPTSSRTKAVFGSSWTGIGPGIGGVTVGKKRISPDIGFTNEKNNGNRAFAALVGAKYLFPIGAPFEKGAAPSFAPYAGVGLGLAYAKIDAPVVGVDDKGFGASASAMLGASFGERFFVEARYTALTETADFNLSGAGLGVGVRF
ncbi:MAG TPA: outer membrane beta-barrel protein [Abditibacterium sp.]